MSRFIIAKDIQTKVKRYNLSGRKVNFKIKPIPDSEDPIDWIKGAVQEVVNHAIQGVEPSDKIGLTFCGESFKEHGPGWLPFTDADQLKMKDVWEMISKIFQSNSKGLSTDTFCLSATTVRLPMGSGKQNKYNSFNEECAMRKGIVSISNKDNLCLPRALVVSIANAIKDVNYRKIRKDTGKIQAKRTAELLALSGVIIPAEGSGITELVLFQKYLVDFKITVYQHSNNNKGRDIMFEGQNENAKYNLNLLYSNGHYCVITSLTAVFCCSYYCAICHQPYDHKNKHRCGGTCRYGVTLARHFADNPVAPLVINVHFWN